MRLRLEVKLMQLNFRNSTGSQKIILFGYHLNKRFPNEFAPFSNSQFYKLEVTLSANKAEKHCLETTGELVY